MSSSKEESKSEKTAPNSESITTISESKRANFHIPYEIFALIWGFVKKDCQILLTVCNLALVCNDFHEFFCSEIVWERFEVPIYYTHTLCQHSIKIHVWEGEEANNWYDRAPYILNLPSEIWRHRKLLKRVMNRPDVFCMPSRADYAPYADDLQMAELFIGRIPTMDFVACLSETLRGNKQLVMQFVRKWPKAIRYCSASLLNDREFIQEEVAIHGSCLEFLGDYRADSELVISASRTNHNVLKYAKGQALEDIQTIKRYG